MVVVALAPNDLLPNGQLPVLLAGTVAEFAKQTVGASGRASSVNQTGQERRKVLYLPLLPAHAPGSRHALSVVVLVISDFWNPHPEAHTHMYAVLCAW